MRTRATARGFVGRTEELVRFRAAIERATSGQPAVLLVSGEAGVGKTRLVEQWLAVADAVGAARLVGHCVQLEHAAYPYAPVIEAIRALCRERATSEVSDLLGPGAAALATLLPELATLPDGSRTLGSRSAVRSRAPPARGAGRRRRGWRRRRCRGRPALG